MTPRNAGRVVSDKENRGQIHSLEKKAGLNASFDWRSMMHKRKHKKCLK